jgi:hypothetical protein
MHDQMRFRDLDVLLQMKKLQLKLGELLLCCWNACIQGCQHKYSYRVHQLHDYGNPATVNTGMKEDKCNLPIFESTSFAAPLEPTNASNHGLTPELTSACKLSYGVSSPPKRLRTCTCVASGEDESSMGERLMRATVMTWVGE